MSANTFRNCHPARGKKGGKAGVAGSICHSKLKQTDGVRLVLVAVTSLLLAYGQDDQIIDAAFGIPVSKYSDFWV